jgi:hypothetical protein
LGQAPSIDVNKRTGVIDISRSRMLITASTILK